MQDSIHIHLSQPKHHQAESLAMALAESRQENAALKTNEQAMHQALHAAALQAASLKRQLANAHDALNSIRLAIGDVLGLPFLVGAEAQVIREMFTRRDVAEANIAAVSRAMVAEGDRADRAMAVNSNLHTTLAVLSAHIAQSQSRKTEGA